MTCTGGLLARFFEVEVLPTQILRRDYLYSTGDVTNREPL